VSVAVGPQDKGLTRAGDNRHNMRIVICALLLLICQITAVAAPPPPSPPAKTVPPPRPGIAIRLLPELTVRDSLGLFFAHDYLTKPEQRPRLEGVRYRVYQVQLGPTPTRIGYVADAQHYQEPTQTVILGGRKYLYTRAAMDRAENGSVTIERIPTTNNFFTSKFHVQGVYSYFDQLFILDAEIPLGGTIYLYEKPAETDDTSKQGMAQPDGPTTAAPDALQPYPCTASQARRVH